ncbi:hypothetical protein JHJ32_02405 [Parapedobacter sp. ISTM3]|uniref:Uncharacterized protein n=1 Tax=Parapedobacter luteus TaxID=623280 RepID=A0A1T5A090_9SPHI|nr:hypothetical protein [Parapedobacter sp. ISTM3]MBK1438827.1 hypothetical protein [Parapedobacter sp. ISTM3]SKB28063.1 hypothetical protein SAMN05660226_00332 [Parapedobacter luteus]
MKTTDPRGKIYGARLHYGANLMRMALFRNKTNQHESEIKSMISIHSYVAVVITESIPWFCNGSALTG